LAAAIAFHLFVQIQLQSRSKFSAGLGLLLVCVRDQSFPAIGSFGKINQ